MPKNYLSIVVLFWNDSEKTIKCLKSIYDQKNVKFTIVLVDNNSDKVFSNKVLNWLKKNRIKVHNSKYQNINPKFFSNKKHCVYIRNKINYGCGLGHNPGYQFSLKHNFKYIARIDNDMFLPKNLISGLCKRLDKDNEIVALSPKIMFSDKPNLVWFRGAKIGFNLKLQKQCSDYTPGHKDSPDFKGLVSTELYCWVCFINEI